jgi:hypothetical protein
MKLNWQKGPNFVGTCMSHIFTKKLTFTQHLISDKAKYSVIVWLGILGRVCFMRICGILTFYTPYGSYSTFDKNLDNFKWNFS